MSALKKLAACTLLVCPMIVMAGDNGSKNIVSIAAGNPSFSTLVTALKAADLVSALQGDGPFTVFAPTNEAFSKVPKETLNNLLKPENKKQLQAVLTYHVVSGRVDAATAMTLSEAATLQGEKIDISLNGKSVMINKAQVITADIGASNGIIHVLDTVILPPSLTTTAAVEKINTMIEQNPSAAGNVSTTWDEKQQYIMQTNL